MSDKKTKLELTWIGKENRPRLEPRILLEEPSLSCPSKQAPGETAHDNVLIQGDNLLALKALEQRYAGQVKCVYIDPPYNVDATGILYDDYVQHSVWLSLMRLRLELLWRLLRPDGVLMISIDSTEFAYVRVLCDELFGRECLLTELIWYYEGVNDNQAAFRKTHEYILVFCRDKSKFVPNKLIDPNVELPEDIENSVVKNSPKNPPSSVLLPAGFPAEGPDRVLRRSDVTALSYDRDVVIAGGKLVHPVTATSGWSSRNILERFVATGFQSVIDQKGQNTRFVIKPSGNIHYVKERDQGYLTTVLRNFGTVIQAEKLLSELGIPAFGYSKPEGLIAFLLGISTSPGDLVLDSFLGSGTTAAVAHKMGRRWIGVELRDHAVTHCVPRLRAVIGGADAGGVTAEQRWKGGGGYRFYRLAPSLLERDKWGNFVISETYRGGPDAGARLAEVMCKLEGFTYAPSTEHFWMHGTSTERDFIYVTTQNLGVDQVRSISEEVSEHVGENGSLLICCGAFRCSEKEFSNITLKKIPSAVLSRCEWDKDDYSLNVAAVTGREPDEPAAGGEPGAPPQPRANGKQGRPKKPQPAQLLPLFTPKEGA